MGAGADDGGATAPGLARWQVHLASARLRIAAWHMLLLAVALVISVAATWVILQYRLEERIGRELTQATARLASLSEGDDPSTGQPFGTDADRLLRVYLQRNVPAPYEVFLTFVDGQPHLRSGGQPDVRLDALDPLTERWADATSIDRGRVEVDGVGTVVYEVTPLRIEGRTEAVFVVAWFRDLDAREITQVVGIAAALGALVLVVAGGVVWNVTGRVLEPVDGVVATAKAISESDLSRRITVQGSDEISRLAATFNEMLDRLEAAFVAQRQFIDDAGHELRTPVTIVRGNLDLLDHDDVDARAATLALVNDELDRMQRLIDDLLTLSKAPHPDFVHPERVDLDVLTTDIVAKVRGLGVREWICEQASPGIVVVDRHRLIQALVQLAQNAVQFTTEGDRIRIGSAWDDDTARLWVADSGRGVDPDEVAHIFERFRRGPGPTTAHEGAGLGLAIVDAIVRAHHGHIEVTREPDGGARFTIVLPVQDPTEPRGFSTRVVASSQP